MDWVNSIIKFIDIWYKVKKWLEKDKKYDLTHHPENFTECIHTYAFTYIYTDSREDSDWIKKIENKWKRKKYLRMDHDSQVVEFIYISPNMQWRVTVDSMPGNSPKVLRSYYQGKNKT